MSAYKPVESMTVKRCLLFIAVGLCFGFSGADRKKPTPKPQTGSARIGSADWRSSDVDAITLAKRAEATYREFRSSGNLGVSGEALVTFKAKMPRDPLGYGNGRAVLNAYFWSPTKFQFGYLVNAAVPTREYLAADGLKNMKRFGPLAPKNLVYNVKEGLFSAGTDGQLVDQWPIQFTKFLFASFGGGNATLTRYVTALVHGVGGYNVSTQMRDLRAEGRLLRQYRILATRSKGKQPNSQVEIIFNGGRPYLPVSINTSYGKLNEYHWTMKWHNFDKSRPLPKTPFTINN